MQRHSYRLFLLESTYNMEYSPVHFVPLGIINSRILSSTVTFSMYPCDKSHIITKCSKSLLITVYKNSHKHLTMCKVQRVFVCVRIGSRVTNIAGTQLATWKCTTQCVGVVNNCTCNSTDCAFYTTQAL